jgi:lipid-binding SYLF domain-containing protein
MRKPRPIVAEGRDLSYSRARTAAGVSLNGSAINEDEDANRDFADVRW